MKTNFLFLFAAFFFASATLALGATNDLSSALQKGLFEEEANHNLEAAAQAYQSVAAQFDKDRKLAATAIFRLGEVYRKQGKTNEANAQYERILKGFSDQTTLAELSRDNLPKIGIADDKGGSGRALKTSSSQSAEEQEIARIKTMIKDSPDLINAASGSAGTPLQLAAQNGWLNAAEFLLANGADVNRKSGNNTPLLLAVLYGRKTMVELLIAKGANLELPDGTAGTALHLAAKMGFKAIAEILLNHKADVNARNSRQNDGNTPLHLAAAAGHKAVAELLLANGADVNGKNIHGATPLFSAIEAKNLEMAKFLIANKADVNAAAEFNSTPLLQTIFTSQPKLMEFLLQNGADTETRFNDNDHRGWTALDWAISQRDMELVKILLDHGANPNSASAVGATPLHYAAMWNKPEMADLLLAHEADVNAKTAAGDTPLFLAVRDRRKPMVELLLEHKADPNQANAKNETPLGYVDSQATIASPIAPLPNAPSGLDTWKEISQLLIKYGADQNQERRTQIAVTRDGQRFPIFFKWMNSWNRFSLLEAFAATYSSNPVRVGSDASPGFPFPKLSNIEIHRLEGKSEREISVDLEAILKSGDCSKDFWLEWGDVIEIPEADHKVNEIWNGFHKELLEMLPKCLARNVSISVKGETKAVMFVPTLKRPRYPLGNQVEKFVDIEFYPWLDIGIAKSGLLRTSSDKARVKVTRLNSMTKKLEEQIFNLEKPDSQHQLWLRDGDRIEIPEKP